MERRLSERLNVQKAAHFAVITNAIQIASMAAVLVLVMTHDGAKYRYFEIGGFCVAFVIVSWGALLDIREALRAAKVAEQADMLEEAYRQLEDLNATLRKQRHDFKNHLQVVYSLLEFGDTQEALKYVESIYTDIQKAGRVLKTAIPAVNALIAAKRQDCDERGIIFDMQIESNWQDMPVSGWEMCRVLGNLIDNARDALSEHSGSAAPRITLSIAETPSTYTFCVSNNGPAIPQNLLSSIFEMGFTTKSDGHGSGLSIVREILTGYGGVITVASDENSTRFTGTIPRRNDESE